MIWDRNSGKNSF